MKIPANIEERDTFYQDLIEKCTRSQDDRNKDYGLMRHFFLFGRGPEDDDCPYNKIYSHIDLLTAFLFAAETTRFSIELDDASDRTHAKRIPAMARALNGKFHDSGGGKVFAQCLLWSLVYNTTIFKMIVRGKEPIPCMLDPGSFGVLREDLPMLDQQEAMVHTYYTTKSQLTLDLAEHPHRDTIVKYLSNGQMLRPEEKPSGLQKMILSATTPNMIGNVNQVLSYRMDYQPTVAEDLIELQELWVWDDKEDDWRVVTRGENAITIYDRKNFFLPKTHCFRQVCPNPMYSYFWGMSEVSALAGLQTWRNERTQQIKKLLNKQVNPPTALTGWMGLLEEKQYAAFNEGSYLTTDSMQAKVERFMPELPQDLFAVIHEIDEMFAEQTGLQNIMQGKGEAGVRSGRQTSELARLGSARVKKRSLVIEDVLGGIGELYLKAMQKYDDTTYSDEDGTTFTASLFGGDYTVGVDAHSNSPLFTEDHKADASFMLENKVIDRASFIDLTRPPDAENLKRKLKDIEKQEAAAAAAAAQQGAKPHGAPGAEPT